jgi:adenylate cyclase
MPGDPTETELQASEALVNRVRVAACSAWAISAVAEGDSALLWLASGSLAVATGVLYGFGRVAWAGTPMMVAALDAGVAWAACRAGAPAPIPFLVAVSLNALRLSAGPLWVAVLFSVGGLLTLGTSTPFDLAGVGVAGALSAAAAGRAGAMRRVVREARRENRWLSETFSRYFSPQVAGLLTRRGRAALATGRREVTVLFADLAGFTRYSEGEDAETVVRTLADYLDELCRVALGADGMIDKFMGDEIMVVFNAPEEQPDHAARALRVARDMLVVVALLNDERARLGMPTLGLSVGVNTGDVVVGHVGGESRVQYTVIGDAVNVAKRLQGLARAGEVVAGARTMELARENATIEYVQVRGRDAPVGLARLGRGRREVA